MREIPSAPSLAVVVGDFAGFEPQTLFNFFTQPELLAEWWPETATLELRVGGEYRFEWPAMGWILTGAYTSIVPGQSLGFTWNWNHEPDKRQRQVDIFLQFVEAGTRLAIYHGEFGEDELEVADRQGIIEGWIHFGMKLAGLRNEPGT
jgi:uncharacterized protein YndB with AHSA1/START domain